MAQSPASPVRVVVADDNADLRRVLACLLDAEPDLCCAGEAECARRVVAVVRDAGADVVVLDARLGDGSGLDVIDELATAVPGAAVLLYSGFDHPEFAAEARRRGAASVLAKSCELDTLLHEIRVLGRRPATRRSA